MILTIILLLVAVAWLLDSQRLRARLARLPVIPPGDGAPDGDFVLLAAPGVTLDRAGRAAGAAYARAHELDLVDLIPARAPAWRLLWIAALPEPARDSFADLPGAGHALLVSRALLVRSGRVWPAPRTAAEAARTYARLSRYARGRAQTAVAPLMQVPAAGTASDDDANRLGLLASRLNDTTGVVVLLQAAIYALALAGPFLRFWPGLAGLAVVQLQPLLATMGTRVRATDLGRVTLLRALLELGQTARLALAWRPEQDPDDIGARREAYAEPPDPARCFEARATRCPLCGGAELEHFLDSPDLVTFKPGTFTLERCGACRHVFQNPRLTPEGLDYYYRDVYDGLGEDMAEALFAVATQPYRDRAEAVRGLVEPRAWLDVGGGHGHFAAVVQRAYPATRVEGLDMSESIDDAARRGWVARAHRGLFPEVAPRLRAAGDRFDVVSMSHYLEHTLEPAAEVLAANQVLAPGGHLMIEVPDPECRLGRLLGRFWFPWLQPQHLHFVSVANLERILRQHGFEPVRWDRGAAHLGGDFFVAAWLALSSVAPPTRSPWRPAPSAADQVVRAVVLVLGLPLLVGGKLLDALAKPLLRRPGGANTYRVVARKVADVDQRLRAPGDGAARAAADRADEAERAA